MSDQFLSSGAPLDIAKNALIVLHGRGATASSILELAKRIGGKDMAFIAPQAANKSWYPLSFLEPIEKNEPYLSEALQTVAKALEHATTAGLPTEKVAIAGFSQGACLTLEFVVRNPKRYGAVIALSGGVIGPPGTAWNSTGSLAETPAFLGCSDVDYHIPLSRVHESAEVLRALGANVTETIYPGMGHTVNEEEIEACQKILSQIP